jgi:glycosyltransferase involved in cell wall biosynthesis
MKKLLIITYLFPPTGGIGVQRPLKFVKYLPEAGIEPIVFCPEEIKWRASDLSNLKLPFLRKTKICRCGVNKLKKYYHFRYDKNIPKHPYNYLLTLRYIWCMDFMSAWFFECRRAALRFAERNRVNCILTTSPPHSTHFFGQYLKKRLKIPWIMDLRDAMYDPPNRDLSKPVMRMNAWIEFLYERYFCKNANTIITVSQPILNSMLVRHKKISLKAKSFIVPNGFDEEDYEGISSDKNHGNNLVITYTGSFIGKQTPRYFLSAVSRLVMKGDVAPKDISLRFVGYFDDETVKLIRSFNPPLPIEITGYQPHKKALKYQVQSDLLLLIVSSSEKERGTQIITGKFFEYLGANVPIFATVPNGPLKKLIENGRFGFVTDPKNVDKIADSFKKVYNIWKLRKRINNPPNIEFKKIFSRKNQAKTLAAIVNKVTSDNPMTFV